MTMLDRREFLVGVGGAAAALAASMASQPRLLRAQQAQNFAPMDQSAYRPVRLDPKPGATPSMTVEERDALEHELKCQCSCVLDVYTCRTTDFTCSVSPAMHRDVLRLVDGGYSADEIKQAFVDVYGEVALTAPVKQGFNWVGYFAPSVVLLSGGVVLTMMLRRWSSKAQASAAGAAAAAVPTRAASDAGSSDAVPAGVSADDMAKLERALREDG
ncbi:MAG: cytochrome c-type biogenesis protein CcmH [Gemmatimonadaceae bacterium]|nr:cytochrome c-type biogenesis protein CcmH [Gemmatimonadaceae bacterium]